MKDSIIVIGVGELGSVFSRGFLKLGYPVQGITRNMSIDNIAREIPNPKAVLISVGEADIHQTIQSIPKAWQNNVILMQNELLPRDWLNSDLIEPTVISVWFEKKKGMDSKVVISSPVFGKHSQLVSNALNSLDLPTNILNSTDQLEYELVRKNCYILTTNIAGLEVGGNVEELAQNNQSIMLDVVNDVLDIQDNLTGSKNNREALIQGMLEAFNGDPEHKCMGRSAPARLERALNIAEKANLEVKKLKEIQNEFNN
jgi:hypothetical protein